MTRVFRMTRETGGLHCLAEIFFIQTTREFRAKFHSGAKCVRSSFNASFYIPVVCEQCLPRHYRSTLSQLRSGHCANLEAYRHKVGRADTPACPQCKAGDQDVAHLFDCAATPTSHSIDDLWLRPHSAATFLSSHPSFSLPPLDPPLPRPPPEPPP